MSELGSNRKKRRKRDYRVRLETPQMAEVRANDIQEHNPDLVVDHEPESTVFTINEREHQEPED